MAKPISDEQLLAMLRMQEKNALGSPIASGGSTQAFQSSFNNQTTTLEVDRYNALNYYFARPFGNEVENQSQVVIPELRDTLEWVMPQLMRVFVATQAPCQFDPDGPTDTDQAILETEAVNHVVMRENEGYFIVHDLIKDALLLRNGYASVSFEERRDSTVENYTGLTQQQVAALMQDKADEEIEVLGQNESQVDMPPGAMPPAQMPPIPGGLQGVPQPGQPQSGMAQMSVFDIKLRRTKTRKATVIRAIPCEEMLVSPDTKANFDDTPFVAHRVAKTRSDLIADGIDEAIVNAASPDKPGWMEMDSLARNVVVDQLSTNSQEGVDFSMQTVEVRDAYMRVDYDGDGIAELRHVLVVGDKIAENEEVQRHPFISTVAMRMPHRHTGMSLYDLLADIQLIKSELVRQGLNGLRLSTNGRVAADWRNVNIADLLTSRSGGVVRTNGPPGNVLMPFVHPSNLMQEVIPMMQYVDTWREFRTGVGESSMGLDADALQNVTKGAQLAGMAAAGLKIELLARCLAEGIKDLFLKVHDVMVEHQDQAFQFNLAGKWVNVDPSTWRARKRVSVNVGLGSGTREEQRANLALMGQMQGQIAQFGLVGPPQAYATFKEGARILGYERPERFALDPSSDEFKQMQAQKPPPQPAPQVQAAQIRAQAQVAQAQASAQRAQAQSQSDLVQAQRQMLHEGLQSNEDRGVQMAQNDSQMWQTLIKALAPIIAQQLKQDPSVNAGAVLRDDLSSAQGH